MKKTIPSFKRQAMKEKKFEKVVEEKWVWVYGLIISIIGAFILLSGIRFYNLDANYWALILELIGTCATFFGLLVFLVGILVRKVYWREIK